MTYTRRRLAATTALGVLMSPGLALPVVAQDSTAASAAASATTSETSGKDATETSLAPITVTRPKDTTPAGTAAASTIGADALAHSQAGTVAKAVANVPGVNIARGDDLLTSTVTIRNFGGNSAMPDSQQVVFALDGTSIAGGNLYRNSAGQIVDPSLLKSVSVLKGPLASLEYGGGIVGGTIAMDTINGADLTGGQHGFKLRQVAGASSNGSGWKTSTTLAWQPNDSFDFLANYARSYSGNKTDGDGNTIDLGGYNVPSILLKARYRFGAAHDQAIVLTYDKSRSVQQNVPYSTASPLTVFGNVNRTRDGHVVSLAYSYKPADNPLIDFTLKASRSHQSYDIVGLSRISSAFAGTYQVYTDTVQAKNTARFQTGGISHTLRAGLEWSHQNHDGIMTGVAGAGKYNRLGLFAIDQMAMAHDLNVSVGGRIERQNLYDLTSTSGTALPDMDTTARSLGVGVDKGLGRGFTAYASFTYSEGLTLPDFAGYANADGVYWGDKVFKTRNWETGLRYEGGDLMASDDRMQASLGLFKTDIWDNTAYPSTSYETMSTSGLEGQVNYGLASGLYSRAALTMTFDDKYRNDSTDWKQYEYALMNQLALTLGKRWERTGWDVSWTLRAGAGQTLDGLHQPGWGVNDLAASYTFKSGPLEGLRTDFGIDNVFDKQYVLQYTTTGPSFPEAGRTFKITFSKTF
ncbi:TonB-dependent receptor domain-containing protein [Acidimangrovimonas sediminis]|uniref:TonB-dependent receptor domain-containing protein n=1 Tax=Acidimangrovimonas sediminis TaxID=2056283 RepID=UPI001304D819|nr:TonB-dependent receptor [Acidimangrovimonas sediminis]